MEATKHLATFVRLAGELLDSRWSGGAQVLVNTPSMYICSLLSGKSSPLFQCLVPERRPAWFRSPGRVFIPQVTGVNHGHEAGSRDPLASRAVMPVSQVASTRFDVSIWSRARGLCGEVGVRGILPRCRPLGSTPMQESPKTVNITGSEEQLHSITIGPATAEANFHSNHVLCAYGGSFSKMRWTNLYAQATWSGDWHPKYNNVGNRSVLLCVWKQYYIHSHTKSMSPIFYMYPS